MSEIYLRLRNDLDLLGVKLVAVSKTFDFSRIDWLYGLGQRDFGENYAQEFLIKAKRNKYRDLKWHFIGRVQSNKSRIIAEYADYCHSFDRIEVAKQIDRLRPNFRKDPLKVCVQVNLSKEMQKSGCIDSVAMFDLAARLSELENIELCGLMLLPSNIEIYGIEVVKNQFNTAFNLYKELRDLYPGVNILSMGMSSDYKLAIDCGSNCVRIGSLIFGSR